MAKRVYLKNLTFSVDKRWLLRAINLHGVPAISVDDIIVVRKTDPFWSTNRECSAFLTYDTEEKVNEAVQLVTRWTVPGWLFMETSKGREGSPQNQYAPYYRQLY